MAEIGAGLRKIKRWTAAAVLAGLFATTGSVIEAASQPKAKTKERSPEPQPSKRVLEDQRLELERQKLAEEAAVAKESAQIERARLEFDESNAWRTLVSSIVPLVVALGTLAYSIWSFRKQTQQQNELQLNAAKLQFEIKAAEIAFSGKTPEAVANRARALKAIFPERLPQEFLSSFDPKQHGGGKESPDEKKFFLELLLKYPDQQIEIYKVWGALFGDEWLKKAEPFIKSK